MAWKEVHPKNGEHLKDLMEMEGAHCVSDMRRNDVGANRHRRSSYTAPCRRYTLADLSTMYRNTQGCKLDDWNVVTELLDNSI